MIYRERWYKSWFISLLGYLRDTIINCLPVKKLPLFIIKLFYGIRPEFIFLIHPRRSQDIFVGLPFLSVIRKFISKKTMMKLANRFPPFVVEKIKTPKGINGLVVGKLILPKTLLSDRKMALKAAYKMIDFSCKISDFNSFIGLGGLWPMVTRRGLGIKNYAKSRRSLITSGHCTTVLSIFLTVKRICKLSNVSMQEVKIVIIGAGKTGSQIAKIFNEKVHTLSLIDINTTRLSRLQKEFKKREGSTIVNIFVKDEALSLKNVFEMHHLGICATSSVKRLMKPDDIPNNFIMIDDSRPEAIPRNLGCEDKIVLEGGLFKIKDICKDYNYGFGINENVFGCLVEAYSLALDNNKRLKPTLGNIDMDNFYETMKFCEEHGITIGDFISQDLIIPEDYIVKIMKNRIKNLKQIM